MYPGGRPEVTVDPGPAGQRFEGEFRPGFFGGVLTVVLKLLHLTRPAVAVFGQKDAQQLTLVRRMVTDLNLDVVIEPVPTVRDADGLATSSRNRYLSAADRAVALVTAAGAAGRPGARRPAGADAVLAAARDVLRAEPALAVDYVALVDPGTFGPAGPGPALLVGGGAGGRHQADRQHGSCASGGRRWRCCSPLTSGTPTPCSASSRGDRVAEHWRIATIPDRTADEHAVVLHGLLAGSAAFTERDISGISLALNRAFGATRDERDV